METLRDKQYDFSSIERVNRYDFFCAKKLKFYSVMFAPRSKIPRPGFWITGVELDLKTFDVIKFKRPPIRGKPHLGDGW